MLAAPALGFTLDRERFPNVAAWLRALLAQPIFAADAARTARFLKTLDSQSHERRVLFWSSKQIQAECGGA